MTIKCREILRLHSQGISNRSIAASLECSRNTVRKVLALAEESQIGWPLPEGMTDKALEEVLSGGERAGTNRTLPDFERVHRELARVGVTLSLLWEEYCERCRMEGGKPYMYSQFCELYRSFAVKTKAALHIEHKPGHKMEADWAGDTASIQDPESGKKKPVYMFVAVLPCSGYTYAEGFLARNQAAWISAHVNAFRFFGGAARILVPDNLKTGVAKADWYSPVINKVYHEMAEHYGTAVVPAGIRKPKEKASVEGTVGKISTWIIAALRDRQFFSLEELNRAVRGKLDAFNKKPFQKKPGSRESAFEEERQFLLPLPSVPFEMSVWKTATVQLNYHISADKMNYSVPYEYIKYRVDVRLTDGMVEVFYQGRRIASHKRLYGRSGQYSTVEAHMPENHRRYAQWNAERFIRWADSVGPYTCLAVKAIIASRKVEEQSYKSCIALLKLAETHSELRLEEACKKVLSYTSRPSYRSVKTVLTAANAKQETPAKKTEEAPSSHGFVRGASYYGGGKNGK
jgi:transposase